MKWWDFSDIAFVSFFTIILILVAVGTIFAVTASISNTRNIKLRNRILSESNTMRIYVVSVKQNKVTYFNRSNLKDKETMDLSEFYSRFHPNDIEKIKSWVFSICVNDKEAEEYLEADAMIEKTKKPVFSLLKLIKYEPTSGVIHIENHILRYMTPANMTPKQKKGQITTGIVKRSVMEQIIKKEKTIYGFTFVIRFFYIKQKVLTNDKVERFMTMTLKNEIYPYVASSKTPRQLIDLSSSEVVLCDLRITNKNDAMRLASSIARSLNKCIALNGFAGSIGYAIGVVEDAQFYQDFDEIIKHAQEACIAAQQNGQAITIYQKTTSTALDKVNYHATISELMKQKNLRYLFRPIIDIKGGRVLGFFEYIRAYNSPFSTFVEMSRYAERIDENKNLLAHVARSIIPKFDAEKPSKTCRLFFSLSMIDIENVIEVFQSISLAKENKIVITFDEQEINENASQLDVLNSSLGKLHAAGYELALSFNDKDLLLDPSIYYNFDYFIAGAKMIGEIKKNNRIRISIHSLIEQLLRYKKPIIATDLEGWQAIELIIKSGVTIVSSEAIAASNDMLLPVDRKKMEKLIEYGENYR